MSFSGLWNGTLKGIICFYVFNKLASPGSFPFPWISQIGPILKSRECDVVGVMSSVWRRRCDVVGVTSSVWRRRCDVVGLTSSVWPSSVWRHQCNVVSVTVASRLTTPENDSFQKRKIIFLFLFFLWLWLKLKKKVSYFFTLLLNWNSKMCMKRVISIWRHDFGASDWRLLQQISSIIHSHWHEAQR